MYFTRQQASWPANLWNTSISAYRRLVLLLYGSSMHFTIHFNFDRNRTHNVCRTKAISFTKMIKIQSHSSKLTDGWSWAEWKSYTRWNNLIWKCSQTVNGEQQLKQWDIINCCMQTCRQRVVSWHCRITTTIICYSVTIGPHTTTAQLQQHTTFSISNNTITLL